MADMLSLCADLPEVTLAPGELLVRDGETTGSIWVLVTGAVEVLKDGAHVNTIDSPGAAFGEIAALLGSGHSADVRAAAPSTLRYAADGREFLHRQPEIMFHIAAGLAERLALITSYLADLRNQYSDAPGVAMVSEVLGKLSERQGPPARPGSAREPEPEY